MSVTPAKTPDARVSECLLRPLAALRRRCRTYLALEGALRVAAALLIGVVVQFVLDRWLGLMVGQRVVLTLILLAVWGWVIARQLVRRLLVCLSDAVLAGIVDRAHPRLQDRIATGVQFATESVGDTDSNSPELVQAVVAEACGAASEVEFTAVLDHRRARRRMLTLAALMLLSLLAAVSQREHARTWFARNWLLRDVAWPRSTQITPLGFDETGVRPWPRGDEVEIAARLAGRVPRSATVIWTAGDEHGRAEMTRIGDTRLTATLGPLIDDLSFHIVGGDEHTAEFRLEAVDRPRIIRTVARVTPPAYTNLSRYTLEQETAFELVRGAGLQLDVMLNKPVVRADLMREGAESGNVELVSADALRVNWAAPESGAFMFEFADEHGFENQRPVRFSVQVVPDAAPVVRLSVPGVGKVITPAARLRLIPKCEDAYGLATVTALVHVDEHPPLALEFDDFTPGRKSFESELTVDVSAWDVEPGQRLRIVAEAGDFDPHGPNVGRSNPVELRIVSAEEFAEQLRRRELDLRRELEHVLSAQRGIEDALAQLLARPDPDRAAEQAQQFAALARRQGWQANRCLALADDFERLLGESRTNAASQPTDEQRLSEGVIAPLDALGRERLPAAAEALAVPPVDEDAATLRATQAEIMREMRAIMANVLQWEDFREAVQLLEELIAEQERVRGATMDALERELDELLDLMEPGDDTPPADQNP